MKEEFEVYRGSGNVFADLNLPDAEERLGNMDLKTRAHLQFKGSGPCYVQFRCGGFFTEFRV